MLIYGLPRLEVLLSMPDLAHLDASVPIISFARLGISIAAYGMTCPDLQSAVMDCLHIGPSALLRILL